MCVLSGCDYLKNIQHIGLVTAHNIVKELKTDVILEVNLNFVNFIKNEFYFQINQIKEKYYFNLFFFESFKFKHC